MLILVPVSVVHGSTGIPSIGVLDDRVSPTTFHAASSFVAVEAGSDTASADNTTAGFFAIQFGGVTFSGSQFYLYLSKDGLSDISAGDVKYAGVFNVAKLSQTYAALSAQPNGTFYSGLVGGVKTLEGPLPIQISSDYKYVKVFDGSTTAVAVSLQTIDIEPGISVISQVTGLACTESPLGACAAGTPVTVKGGGFPSSRTIGINYSYAFQSWRDVISTKTGVFMSGISTGTGGYFSQSSTLPDTKQSENTVTVGFLYSDLTFTATTSTHPQSFYSTATTDSFEILRVFTQVESLKPDGSVSSIQASGPYGNDTGGTTFYDDLTQPINAYPTGSLGIAGNHSDVGAAITVKIDSTTVPTTQSSPTADNLGQYVINVTIPALSLGTHHVYVIDNGVAYEFDISIVPTIILTPHTGTVGTTVAVSVYGFPSNRVANFYWFEYSSGENKAYFLGNGTVSSDGSLNVTVTFVVPASYGGDHAVYGTNVWFGTSVTTPLADLNATFSATFDVLPTLVICNGPTCGAGDTNADTVSVNANTRTLLSAVGSGLDPNNCVVAAIDNAQNDFNTCTDAFGNTYMNFTAAGFRPGLHQVEVYECNSVQCVGAPDAWAFFNVTTTGDYVVASIPSSVSSAVNTALSGFSNQLTAIQSSLTTITSDVSGLSGQLTTIAGDVQGLSGLGSQMTTLGGKIDTLTSSLSGITGSLTSIQSSLTSAANNAQTAATDASNAANGASTAQTYVLVVAVLAAITLVLELAILVRKLS